MEPKRILGIDPASRTGWAYLGADGRRLFGGWVIAKNTDRHPGDRLRRFRDGLRELAAGFPVDLVACEDSCLGVGERCRQTLRMHAELLAVVKLLAADLGVPVVFYAPITIKAFAGCAGKTTRGDKSAMVRACNRLLDIETDDDDAADALFILEMARQGIAPPAKSAKRATGKPRAKPQGRLF